MNSPTLPKRAVRSKGPNLKSWKKEGGSGSGGGSSGGGSSGGSSGGEKKLDVKKNKKKQEGNKCLRQASESR